MTKVLMLPLLNIPSGHHQVADAISTWLRYTKPDIVIEKIEIISHLNPTLEKLISQVYLKWIHHFPRTYAWTYRQLALGKEEADMRKFRSYEWLFLREMKGVISEASPDLIICTQSFPSYLCNQLKQRHEINIPIVNIYTDFIANQVWGIDKIDLHFTPNHETKEKLLQLGVDKKNIFVTGIPVDYRLYSRLSDQPIKNSTQNILIAGGSIGFSFAEQLLIQLEDSETFCYTVLCGRNERLFRELQGLKDDHIIPLPYIDSKEEMSKLYDQMDAIITKPGGVTISESIHKRLPIFIHTALPGQEEMNRLFLLKKGLAYELNLKESLENQLLSKLMNQFERRKLRQNMDEYIDSLEWEPAMNSIISHF